LGEHRLLPGLLGPRHVFVLLILGLPDRAPGGLRRGRVGRLVGEQAERLTVGMALALSVIVPGSAAAGQVHPRAARAGRALLRLHQPGRPRGDRRLPFTLHCLRD
jgi:hypothetical protein